MKVYFLRNNAATEERKYLGKYLGTSMWRDKPWLFRRRCDLIQAANPKQLFYHKFLTENPSLYPDHVAWSSPTHQVWLRRRETEYRRTKDKSIFFPPEWEIVEVEVEI